MHTLTHAAAKLLLLVKLPSLYKYIRFQRAIRAKSRRYMEESEGGEREGRRKGTGILYLVDKQTPPCRCSAVHGGAYFTFHSEKKFRPLNWIIKDCTTAKCARRVGGRRQRRRRWPHGCLSVTWFRATGREAAELARKKRYVSPLIIFLNGSFPRKNAALSLSTPPESRRSFTPKCGRTRTSGRRKKTDDAEEESGGDDDNLIVVVVVAGRSDDDFLSQTRWHPSTTFVISGADRKSNILPRGARFERIKLEIPNAVLSQPPPKNLACRPRKWRTHSSFILPCLSPSIGLKPSRLLVFCAPPRMHRG